MELGHFGFVVGQGVDWGVIDFGDYVTAGEVNVFGEAGRFYFSDDYTGDFGHAELARKIGCQLFDVQTQLAGRVRLIGLIPGGLRDLRENFGAVGHQKCDVFGLFVADVAHLHGLADDGFRDGIYQVGAAVHRLAVDIGNDVAGLQTGFIGGAARLDGFDDDAVGHAEFLHEHGVIAAIFLERDADGTAGDFAVGDELIVNHDHGGGGQREADTFESAAAGVDGGVDADYFASHVHERAARIAGVDGGIGLNEALKLMADVGAVFRADDSRGDGGVQAEGTTDGEDPVANLNAVGIAKLGDGKIVVGFNFNDGQVGVFIEADDTGAVFGGIAVESDLNFGGLVNDVIVGEDKSFFIHDYAGAETAFCVGAIIRLVKETVEEILKGIAEFFGGLIPALGLFDYLGGGDVDDGGAKFFRDGGKGVRHRDGIGHGEECGAGGGALVVSGLRVAGDQRADHDADGERADDEESGENFAAAHPAEQLLKFNAHSGAPYTLRICDCLDGGERDRVDCAESRV